MKRDSALFLSVACVAVAVWTSSVTLSQHLAHVEQPTAPAERAVDQFTDLRNAIAARPDDIEARRALADALAREGVATGNSSILAEGLETYLRILQKEPENEGALLGIASLAFQAGVLDKAAEYSSKYLQLVPDDVKAKTDLALVYVQSDRAEMGIPLLEEIKRDAPTLFPAALSLALA
ncbi:MAG: hypothetical protein IT290_06220 [Deltaproteobacteria bacterium]|nr:hypothetical protein [Deltaproteobacteria bacterium]